VPIYHMLRNNATRDTVYSAENVWKQLGRELKYRRAVCGLSVREIEKRSGVAYRTLYAYENAEHNGGIRLDKLVALCQAMMCDPLELMIDSFRSVKSEDE